jgi:thioredoxin 1
MYSVCFTKGFCMAAVEQIDDRTFSDVIANGTVLVDFSAEWCGPCRMLAPILEALAEQLGDKVKIVSVDVDQSQGLALQYDINSVPTLLLFKNGKLRETIVGLRDLTSLRNLLEEV